MRKQQITLDLSACHTEPIRPTWRNLLNIGYARCGLLAPIQEQIRTAQREIGFRYVRFHGIFDSDMHIYERTQTNSRSTIFSTPICCSTSC